MRKLCRRLFSKSQTAVEVAMLATVDRELCTGCGLCADICPEAFAMDGEMAVASEESIPPAAESNAREAKESCPVEAIELSE